MFTAYALQIFEELVPPQKRQLVYNIVDRSAIKVRTTLKISVTS